jgi:hypothetical protein
MTEQEKRDMARRLAQDSNVFDFDRALEVVRRRPTDAEKLIRNREEMRKRQEERALARQQLRQAIREEFG